MADLSPLHIIIPCLSLLIAVFAVWCTTGSRLRRRLGVVIGALVVLPPWFLPSRPIVRAVFALVAFTWEMRVIDLASVDFGFLRRVLHAFSVIDTRRLVRRSPRFESRAFVQLIGWSLLAGVALLLLARLRGSDASHVIGRWLSADLGVYSAVAGLYCLLSFAYSAIGFDTPPLHLAPILSRSVAELWGERWARPISDWLGDTFFRPFARRRRLLTGVVLAFLVSASFHAYGIWVGLGFFAGATMAASTFGFFVAQGVVMIIERRLKVRTWRPIAGHTWTVMWMIGLSPLFMEPVVRLLRFG